MVQEDPELTSSHGHSKSIAYERISSVKVIKLHEQHLHDKG